MSIETTKDVLLWCAIINYAIVIVWFVPVALARRRLYGLWGRWFQLSAEQFDALNFLSMAICKIGILLFNVVPYIASAIST